MKNEELQWSKAAVLICTKCGKSIPGAPENVGEDLKNELKAEMKNRGMALEVRVMTSSCLNICEAGFQAVAILPTDASKPAVVKVLDPVTERDALKAELLKL